jgi:hypothetical protein
MGKRKSFAKHYKAPFPNELKASDSAKPASVPETPEPPKPQTPEENRNAAIIQLSLAGMRTGPRTAAK